MNIMSELKELLKEENKNYLQICDLLNELYNINNQVMKNKKEIEFKIKFFIENINELKKLRDSFIHPEKNKKEKDESKNEKEKEVSKKEKEKDESKKEKEKDESKNEKEKEVSKNEKENKNNFILKPSEINELKNTFNNINIFANEINNYIEKEKKIKYIPYNSFKNLVDAFINPNLFKEKKYIKKQKEVIDEKQKAEINYKKICETSEIIPINIEKLYGLLNNINLKKLEKNQVKKLIEISINSYYYLTEKQKEKINDKFYELIGDDEIADILYLNTNNIFAKIDRKNSKDKVIYENLLEYLCNPVDDYPREMQYGKKDKRQNGIKRNNVFEILLSLYKDFMMYKNKDNSFVNLNKCNIIEKIYYYFIINFISYEDEFEDGKKLYDFLYIKYLFEEKYDYRQLIKNKENIQKEIIIFTDEDLKNQEKNDKNLKNDDLEEFLNEEEEDNYSIQNKLLINNLKKFIPEEYIQIYFEVQQNLSNFYLIPFPTNILVNSDNINFTFSIIDMILFNKKYYLKNDWITNYRNNLLKLENNIFNYYISSTEEYTIRENTNGKNNKLIGYKVNEKMKNVYDNLIKYLYSKLPKDNNYKIEFIPFGSVTQFLSGKNGDIDLFMNIESSKENSFNFGKFHQKILNKLMIILKNLDKNLVFHQTNRLCLYTLEYEGIKIDINVYGICSYYGEILLREYSLMDFRFPMLVIYLKYIIGKYNIKNTEEDKSYINSFAWTNILLTFLQDILDPPLFPKLLSEKNKDNITIKVGGGFGKDKRKQLENEIECQRERDFVVMELDEDNNNIKNIKQIKDQFYGKEEKNIQNDTEIKENMTFTGKNKMSVSEILLKFIQFIGFFFNYKYTMVDTSYEFQGFMPKIEKIKSKDGFVNFVYKKCDSPENTLLIREPFDHTYNPCKSVPADKLDKIQEEFKKIYINILEKGEI